MRRRATYRLQLRAEFGFAEAAAQADYLAALGVSHAYCSPYLQAAEASTHGYDVVDPTRISEELGGDEGQRLLTQSLAARGLGQLLDIVPNHMSIADRRNRWWWDVLADGQSSPYALFFDIDWEVDERRLRHRVLLPVLADQVGRVLEEGGLRLVREDGAVTITYADNRYPLSIESTGELLVACGAKALAAIAARIDDLPAGQDAESRRARFEERVAILHQVAAALGADAAAPAALDACLDEINADIARLDHLLNEQHHRLARWQTALEEVNYRRFFDINTLVALRIEDPEVFAQATTLVAELVQRGDVDGLRIDHIDGLRRPLEYAARLRDAAGASSWLLAEKILSRGEQPPPWSLDGTSGYDFLAAVNGLFVDPRGRDALAALHTEITGQESDFEPFARDGKREVLRTTLVSDVERITSVLASICDVYPAQRDHTRTELTEAISEMIVAIPVYRTYVDPGQGPATDIDAGMIRGAAAQALNECPQLDGRLLDFIADLFVFGEPEDVATNETANTRGLQRDMVQRVQQLCAAATAKGVEDTACYRHLVLVSVNEVGDSPARFGVTLDEFHEHNARTQEQRPLTLLTTSTHDTKRSEDVRARIDLLSEIPDEWSAAVRRWTAMNRVHRPGGWSDASMEYLLYQTLVGAWPLSVERATAYMEKASREAKQHTGWLQPNEEYDSALREFVIAVLADERFVADLRNFVGVLVPYGRVNSLATTLLKLTSPGVADIYQGTELWDLSLVDPDNRRPVDYAQRRRLLEAAAGQTPAEVWARDPDSGAAKLSVISTALALRGRHPEAFDERGVYTRRRARGEFADDVIAFTRGRPASVLSLAQRRSLRRRDTWGDSMITLPDGRWHNLCDGSSRRDAVAIADLLESFPVALLERTT